MTDSPTPAEAMPERETFSSRIGFLFLSAGCAIGLGNVWRFPFITGQYGGAWFVLIYLLFLLFLGIPLVLTELACGRASQRSIARSFDVLEPPGTKWHWYKWIGMAGNYLLMMFYVPVTGWILCYAVKSARGDFSGIPAEESAARIGAQFQQLLDSPGVMVLYMAVVVILCYGICAIGLRKGVERITKYIMAGLFLLLIALAVNSLTLPGGKAGLAFYLKPDWSRLCEAGIGNALIAAMGQAFFTLGLGVGSLAIFGSHLTRRRTLVLSDIAQSGLSDDELYGRVAGHELCGALDGDCRLRKHPVLPDGPVRVVAPQINLLESAGDARTHASVHFRLQPLEGVHALRAGLQHP